MAARLLSLVALVAAVPVALGAEWSSFDTDWRFSRGDSPGQASDTCSFPTDLQGAQCLGLAYKAAATTTAECAAACCAAGPSCETWNFCPEGAPCVNLTHTMKIQGCWVGKQSNCPVPQKSLGGWISKARLADPSPAPAPCSTDYCKKSFNDAAWRSTETPHDWAIEDLPARADDAEFPVLEVRNGSWLFKGADEASFSDAGFDDGSWTTVTVPHDWRDPPASYTNGTGSVGWYRRHLATPTAAQIKAAQAGTLQLALGTVANQAEVWINGKEVGSTGRAEHVNTGCEGYLLYRRFSVPAGVLSATGPNVIAVRVRCGDASQPGGLYDSMAPDMRSGPFDPASSPGQKQTGYTVAGVGWYRKAFATPSPLEAGARAVLRFDGVYMHSELYLNEKMVASHPYGYTTFEVDITEHLAPAGQSNLLAIRVQSAGSNSRWYAGAGIYRHVHMATVPAVHALTFGGVGVTTKQSDIDLARGTATVTVVTSVHNSGAVAAAATVAAHIAEPASAPMAGGAPSSVALASASIAAVSSVVSVPAGATVNVSQSIPLPNAQLWSPDAPNLYSASVSVTTSASTSADRTSTSFGVRHITFSNASGFSINGVSMKLRGGCVHHDNGPLGSKTLGRAEERRVENLKAAGYNAIRTSHNPVSPAFVAACDRLGVLLMEEAFDCWDDGKNSEDYHLYFDEWWQRDVTSMVMRDRNSPSIVMWSIGNEIPMRRSPKGIALSATLADFVRSLDPIEGNGRAVTSAYPGAMEDTLTDQFLAPLDVAGYNYGWSHYVPAHKRVPSRVIAGTESFPLQSFQTWQAVLDNSWVIGDFIWTAIDYIGESAIGGTGFNTPDLRACGGYCPQGWSWHISFCGDLDIVGHRKPQSLYRTVLWNASQLEIAVHEPVAAGEKEVVASWGWPTELPSWTWDAPAGHNANLSVNVYSRHAAVDLVLNGRKLTPAPLSVSRATQFTASFTLPYERGTLQAIGYDAAGKQAETKTIATAGKAAAIRLTADRSAIRAERDDLSYVTAEVVDANGVLVPTASTVVRFEASGVGELAAVGSGDPADTGSFYLATRRSYRGKSVAVLRPGGTNKAASAGSITLTASASGLRGATLTVHVQEPPAGEGPSSSAQ